MSLSRVSMLTSGQIQHPCPVTPLSYRDRLAKVPASLWLKIWAAVLFATVCSSLNRFWWWYLSTDRQAFATFFCPSVLPCYYLLPDVCVAMLQSKILSIPWVYRSSMMKSWIQPKWYASSASSFNSAVMVFLSTAKDKPLVYCTLLYVLAWPGPTFHAHSVASCCPCHFSNSCHVFHVWSVASCCLHHVSNKFELLLADKSYADAH